jgi:hypothetical protein
MKTLIKISAKVILLIVGFTFQMQANTVVDLEWKTKSETNNDFFTIERSMNGSNWEKIGTIYGNGTTSAEHSYSFTDENAPEGIVYYSLKQTDFDGKSVNTKIISIDDSQKSSITTVVVYPNPTTSFVSLKSDEKVTVTGILSNNSTQVTNSIYQNGNTLDVQNLEEGMYYIVYNSADGQVHTAPFIKK